MQSKVRFCNILGPDVEFGLKTGYVTAMLRQIASLRRGATANFAGKPTLRSDLPKLVRYGKQLGIERMVCKPTQFDWLRRTISVRS